MMTNVYRAGVVVATIPVDEGATCKRTIAGVDEITMDVVQSNGSLPVMIGDYIVFEGNNYYLNRPTKVDKKSIVEYHFSLTFEADIYSLLNKLFQQPVTGRGDFGLVDTLEGFVDVLLSNINGIEGGWTKGAIPVTERKLMSFDGENCRAVLNRLADEFDVEFNVIGKQISFYDLYENATSLVFEHGQGKGLYELSRDNVDSNNTVTRGWFWGANKNIDYTYRDGETRLVFTNPATGTNRIDNFGDFSKSVEKQIIFEDVWPQFTGIIATVSNDAASGVHTFTCPLIDFDVTLQMIEGVAPKVFFKSGDLQSQEFEIKSYDHPTRTITLITYTDEFGQVWPNASFFPKAGNQFTFIGLKMPDSYVVAAEAKLAEKAAEWMDYYSKLRVKYSLDLDPRYLRSNAITLNRGDVVRIIDASLGIDKQIRITSIEKSVENPYKVKCEISNILEERWEKKISKQVLEALNNSKTANEKVSSTTLAIGSFFGRYFEVRGTAGNEYIMAKMPFASVGEVSAYASSGLVIPSLWDALPTASATVKGGIKIGSGLSIDANGIVSVTSQGTIQTLSLSGTTLSISGGNSVTIPATYTDVMARAACALSGAVYDSARLGNVSASTYTRRDVAEGISSQWAFSVGLFAGTTNQGTLIEYDATNDWGLINPVHQNVAWTSLQLCQISGNVGIGMGSAAPTYKLHVNGSGGFSSDVSASRYNNGVYYGASPNNARNHFTQYNLSSAAIDVGWIAAAFGDNTGDRFVIGAASGKAIIGAHNGNLTAWADLGINPQGGGKIGIGRTPVEFNVELKGVVAIGQFTNGAAVVDAYNGVAYFGCNTATNGFTIDSSGNCNFTKAIYGNRIGVSKNDAASPIGISLWNNYESSTDGMPNYGLFFGTTTAFGAHGSVSGYATYFTMESSASWGWIFRSKATNTNVLSISAAGHLYASGNITATGEVTAYAASDRRLKTNIKTITNACAILRQLRAVEYDWNETAMRLNPAKRDAPHSVSFIAQEWEKILPWATHLIFGKYKSIDLNVMTGYLVAGWNEHDKKLTTHDKEINQLRQRVGELEKQLNKPQSIQTQGNG